MFKEFSNLPEPPRHLRRGKKLKKDPDPAIRIASEVLEAGRHHYFYEANVERFLAVIAVLDAAPDFDWVHDSGEISDAYLTSVIVKTRHTIAWAEAALRARQEFIAAIEKLIEFDPSEAMEYEQDLIKLRALPEIDLDATRIFVLECEQEAARREKAKREARRKPPRAPEVVVVDPVVVDTTCSECHRERKFIIEGVAYCGRHVPPHLRPHGRI